MGWNRKLESVRERDNIPLKPFKDITPFIYREVMTETKHCSKCKVFRTMDGFKEGRKQCNIMFVLKVRDDIGKDTKRKSALNTKNIIIVIEKN